MGGTMKPLADLRVDTAARRKLRFYSETNLKGRKVDYRTTFYSVNNDKRVPVDAGSRIPGANNRKPISRKFIVNIFAEQIFKAVKEYPEITKFERTFLKYANSSRSIVLPGKERLPKLLQSFENQEKPLEFLKSYPNSEELLKAAANDLAEYIHQYIPRQSVRPGSIDKIIQRMQKTTNGGFPYLLTGRVYEGEELIEDNVPKYVQIAKAIRAKIAKHETIPIEWCAFIALGRSQEGASETQDEGITKNRIVGGDAHGATIIAGMTYPLLDQFKLVPTRAILNGLDSANVQLKKFIRSSDSTILSADQSAFDNHIRADISIKYIVPIIMDLMHGSSLEDKYAVQGYLTEHMGKDPIVCPDGVRFGTHGMPSGVLGVNEFDSLYLQFINFLFNRMAGRDIFKTIAVQGDDIVIETTLSTGSAAGVYSKYCKLLGLEANELKQFVGVHVCTFVKRLGTLETENGYRSQIGSLIAEMNMERPKAWREYMYEARGGSILCNHYLTDPGISQFFGQISLGYEYLLGLDFQNGYYTILQKAGGVERVSSRLDLAHYANHLGTRPSQANLDAGELDVGQLTIMQGQKEVKDLPKPQSWVGDRLGSNDGIRI